MGLANFANSNSMISELLFADKSDETFRDLGMSYL